MLQKPILSGKTDKENLHILETWASNLVDQLNHSLTHIDNTNVVSGLQLVSEEHLEKAMQEQYKELRKLIVKRTKGE